jgi:hypothetical protein
VAGASGEAVPEEASEGDGVATGLGVLDPVAGAGKPVDEAVGLEAVGSGSTAAPSLAAGSEHARRPQPRGIQIWWYLVPTRCMSHAPPVDRSQINKRELPGHLADADVAMD